MRRARAALARELRAAGHAVRGTTRGAHTAEIAATGAEPYVGDPDRIATLMDALHGVTIVCWLTGTIRATWTPGGCGCCWRSSSTPACAASSTKGRARRSPAPRLETWQIPLEVLSGDPLAEAWVAEAVAAVDRLLS